MATTFYAAFAPLAFTVLGIWFLPRPAWDWLQIHASSPRDLAAAIRAIPMALVAGWISFGILGPLLDMILGKYAAKPWETLDLLLRRSPLLLVFVTVFFSWPLVLIPPGARTEELRGDARWFEQHPFVGLALIGVVIVVSIAASCASHR